MKSNYLKKFVRSAVCGAAISKGVSKDQAVALYGLEGCVEVTLAHPVIEIIFRSLFNEGAGCHKDTIKNYKAICRYWDGGKRPFSR